MRRRLDHLAEIGVTAIELMPVAQFGGERGWGYDGVLLYAPHVAYGGPEGLKRLVDAAHERGLMMFLDVVYNHFGPDGNYLHLYAPDFFHPERHTPWGAAIAYEKQPVRDFFIENALYWLEEYRFDGLRLDADRPDRRPVRRADPGGDRARRSAAAFTDRHVHLMTEDDRNITRPARARRGRAGRSSIPAEWNDDFHHAAHVIATGETIGYYCDYADDAGRRISRGRWRPASSIRASRRPTATARRAASRARICRRPPSSISCRTTTRSATAPSASGWPRWPSRRSSRR